MTLWLIIISIGLFTYGVRLVFIVLSDRVVLPALAQRALRFVPVAILTAIVVPALVYPAGTLNLSPLNARLLAGTIAIVIAWRTHNIALTLAGGMGALWLLIWLVR